MTREEAIKILKGGNNRECTWLEYCEAFNMAIQALEQEPILDKIRAEIEQFAELGDVGFTRNLIPKDIVLGIIDKYKAESEVDNG